MPLGRSLALAGCQCGRESLFSFCSSTTLSSFSVASKRLVLRLTFASINAVSNGIGAFVSPVQYCSKKINDVSITKINLACILTKIQGLLNWDGRVQLLVGLSFEVLFKALQMQCEHARQAMESMLNHCSSVATLLALLFNVFVFEEHIEQVLDIWMFSNFLHEFFNFFFAPIWVSTDFHRQKFVARDNID